MSFNLDGLISSLLAKSCKCSFSLKMFINQIVIISNYEEWFWKFKFSQEKKLLLYDRTDKKISICSSNHLHVWGDMKSLTSTLNPWLSDWESFQVRNTWVQHRSQKWTTFRSVSWVRLSKSYSTTPRCKMIEKPECMNGWMDGWMDGWITMKVKMRSKKIQNIPPTNNFNFCKSTTAECSYMSHLKF